MTSIAAIYYTGDMANPSGWFVITRETKNSVDLVEVGGDRTIRGIGRHQIGTVYEGHCGTRFVTRQAYDDYRAARARK